MRAAGVTGYYLLNDDAERIMAVIEELFRRGTKILFDPSPLADAIRPDILRRMAEVSHIMTPNVTELKVLEEKAGKRLISKGGVQNSLKDQICQSKAPVLIVKDGSAGGTVYTPGTIFSLTLRKSAPRWIPRARGTVFPERFSIRWLRIFLSMRP